MKNLILHLRLNLSIVLAPIFLWGFYLSEGEVNYKFILAFISYHIFLYGGSNAYNSYYDKDEGPIGGLKNPPKVTTELLYFSLLNKFLGLIISYFINIPFFITYLLFFVLSVIYSHPKTRWKSNPYLSIFTIGFGQGLIAFFAGWFSTNINTENYSLLIFGSLTTFFMSMGIYPLTQLYQIEEDSKRNDKTFAVYWGIKNSFKFASFCIILSCLSMLTVLYILNNLFDLILISIFYSFFLVKIVLWAINYEEKDIMANYNKIMKLNYTNGLGFMLFIVLHLLQIM